MEKPLDVSVIISTYNRCDILPRALESLLAQETGGVRYEVVIADNNSTDQTRQVVESFIKRGYANLSYVFEAKQGVSHGRNAAITMARAPIIAITDDDVQVAPNWVAAVKRAFDEHPEVDFIGGKVLPRRKSELPSWLTREHWSPLALQDNGETPFYVDEDRPLCLVTANASFRREVFEWVGLFSPDFPRSQDHELEVRVWRAGRQGMYVPEIVVTAEVQTERMIKAYHCKWYLGHGKAMAMMRLNEIIDHNGRLLQEPLDSAKLFGAPAFVYRELLGAAGRWLRATVHRSESLSFQHEARMRDLVGYILKCYEQHVVKREHSGLAEVSSFLRTMLRKKIGGYSSETTSKKSRRELGANPGKSSTKRTTAHYTRLLEGARPQSALEQGHSVFLVARGPEPETE